ncbi:MAG: hypothetical protein KC431_18280 [Myxococcales bacterium]|nr:hypothetical protein [Myxococcales bacterium]
MGKSSGDDEREHDRRLEAEVVQLRLQLSELRHALRNDLQLLSSIMALRLRQLDDPTARAQLARCKRLLGALGVVYQQDVAETGMLAVDSFLAELVAELEAGRPAIAVRSAALAWRHDRATHIAVILDELLGPADCKVVSVELEPVPPPLRPEHGPETVREWTQLILSYEGLPPVASPMTLAVIEQIGAVIESRPLTDGGCRLVLWLPLQAGDPHEGGRHEPG